ncbi:hypothetical protein COB64_03545 [Candidatus Wolfebacteria bacterium]|nr:MAG: hypothetical protein COB64_03545 [Candidatus Wolfebacteria bacterium]
MSMKDQRTTPEKILLVTEKIEMIIYPKEDDLLYNGKSILKLFKEASLCLPEEIQKLAIQAFPRYVASPIILDVFEDFVDPAVRDAQRYDFEKTLQKEGLMDAYEFYRSNKLRRTHISNVLVMFPLIHKTIGINDLLPIRLISRIHSLISSNPTVDREKKVYRFDNYEMKLSLREKLKVIEFTSQLAYTVCVHVIEYHQKQNKS